MFVETRNGDLQYIPLDDHKESVKRLTPGAYDSHFNMEGTLFLTPTGISGERIVNLDTDPARRIQREITSFFDTEITERLMSANLKHRRAILLYGPAGTGKTSLVRGMFPQLIANNAVILIDPDIASVAERIIPAIRLTDPNRPVVLVFDEFHSAYRRSGVRTLQLLDGLDSPEHMLFIGTTNYIARLPETLRARPSRFSLVLEIATLPRSAKVAFTQGKYGMIDEATLGRLVDLTDAMALDYLEEACRLFLMGFSPEEIEERFKVIYTRKAVAAAKDNDDDDDY